MKKILCFALGALFCFSSFALTQMTMKNGKVDSQLTPMKIGNICVFNPGGQYSVSEEAGTDRMIGTTPYIYKSKVATTLCQYNVGTALYGVTNINVVIPANTTIRCKCKDDQTEVAVIYE